MSKNTNTTTTGQVYTGSGCIEGIIVSTHSSGTIKLVDAPNSNVGRVILDTYTFASGSTFLPMYGAEFYEGIYATIGGTGVSLQIVYKPSK